MKTLSEKYAVSYEQLQHEAHEAQNELAGLVDQLTGDDFAIEGLKALVKE